MEQNGLRLPMGRDGCGALPLKVARPTGAEWRGAPGLSSWVLHHPLWLPPFTVRDARPRAGHGLAKATQRVSDKAGTSLGFLTTGTIDQGFEPPVGFVLCPNPFLTTLGARDFCSLLL